MVLRCNIGHRYTDSVTIMAAVGRRTARRELVTRQARKGLRAARSVPCSYEAQANVRADKPNAAIPPSRA